MTEAEYTLKIDRRANMSHDPAIWIDAVNWSRKNPPPEVLALVAEAKKGYGWYYLSKAIAEFEKVIEE